MTITATSRLGDRQSRPTPPDRCTERLATTLTTAAPALAVTIQVTLTAESPDGAEAVRNLLLHLYELDCLTAPPRVSVDTTTSDAYEPTAAPGIVHIDATARTVTQDGRQIQVSRREFDLLLFLARYPARVFSRGQLLNAVWGNSFTGERTVDVHVTRLRHKLKTSRELVTTVRGVGYRLATDAPVAMAGTPSAPEPPAPTA